MVLSHPPPKKLSHTINPPILSLYNNSSGPCYFQASEDLLRQHYADLSKKPFFPDLVSYMASGPVVPMVWEGLNVVKTGRVMLGATNPADSAPGTIRGDFCVQVGRNICHGSDGNCMALVVFHFEDKFRTFLLFLF